MRNIEDILKFRADISPFLTHLTKSSENMGSAKYVLQKILNERCLLQSDNRVSSVSYGGCDDPEFLSAICFTETPLAEIHCLLEIDNRHIELEGYGLVFKKGDLKNKGVSPAIYLNNSCDDQDQVVRTLATLAGNDETAAAAKMLIPLVTHFGNYLTNPYANGPAVGKQDFAWEREWRFPKFRGNFNFTMDDIFIGLCPDSEIPEFESQYPLLKFIDPTKPAKWYASKLVELRRRAGLEYSVV